MPEFCEQDQSEESQAWQRVLRRAHPYAKGANLRLRYASTLEEAHSLEFHWWLRIGNSLLESVARALSKDWDPDSDVPWEELWRRAQPHGFDVINDAPFAQWLINEHFGIDAGGFVSLECLWAPFEVLD